MSSRGTEGVVSLELVEVAVDAPPPSSGADGPSSGGGGGGGGGSSGSGSGFTGGSPVTGAAAEALQKKLEAESSAEQDYERAVSALIDNALDDSTLPVAEVLQQVGRYWATLPPRCTAPPSRRLAPKP
jgi:hypothetical protein